MLTLGFNWRSFCHYYYWTEQHSHTGKSLAVIEEVAVHKSQETRLHCRHELACSAQKPCNTSVPPATHKHLLWGLHPCDQFKVWCCRKVQQKTQVLIKPKISLSAQRHLPSWSLTQITVLCPRPRQILCFNSPWSCFALLALLIVLLTACPFISDLTAWP